MMKFRFRWRIVLMQWDRKLGWWRRVEPTERIDLRILARERAAKRKAKGKQLINLSVGMVVEWRPKSKTVVDLNRGRVISWDGPQHPDNLENPLVAILLESRGLDRGRVVFVERDRLAVG